MNRAEHLNWAKERALEYARKGDANQAIASITSDLNKHDETRGHAACELGLLMALNGHFRTPAQIVEFIEGFN